MNAMFVGLALVLLLVIAGLILLQSSRRASALKTTEQTLANEVKKFNDFSTYRTHVAQITTELQQANSFETLARAFLSHVTAMIGAHYGTVFVLDEDTNRLMPVGTYGAQETDVAVRCFSLGDGLVGQCAQDKQGVTIVSIPDTPLRVVSGLGYTVPRQVLLQALQQKGKVVGVIEMAAITAFDDKAAHLLDELMPTLAMNIEILDRNLRTRTLLDATQAQALQLEQQQAQLQDSFLKRDQANKALQSQVAELASARRATLNIMEDLEDTALQLTARRDELEKSQLILQEKTNIIEASRREIQEIHQHTRDSIEYAAIIQRSILPKEGSLQQSFPASFATWNPKDIVGGDIWFFESLRIEGEFLLFVIDCTGHGVPGAFVTMLVKSVQRGIMSRYREDANGDVHPGEILSVFNREIKQLLDQNTRQSNSNAGFDGGILYFDKNRGLIRYSGAETPLFLVDSSGKCKTIKGARHSVGYRTSDENFVFEEQEFSMRDWDRLYLSTDGLLDQNGGAKDIPYGKKRLVAHVENLHDKPIEVVRDVIMQDLEHWQGRLDRNDDICFVGIKL